MQEERVEVGRVEKLAGLMEVRFLHLQCLILHPLPRIWISPIPHGLMCNHQTCFVQEAECETERPQEITALRYVPLPTLSV